MISGVKGMNDILPAQTEPFLQTAAWRRVESVARTLLENFGFRHVLLPVVEDTALFARGIGQDTDIVSKEMYTFTDRGERSLTLRPEGTAGAVRAYIEHNFQRDNPVQKWWYFGPMYRAERPQKGRYRQFYQVGAEFFGAASPAADAEMMFMLHTLLQRLGIANATLRLNSLGDDESRAAYRQTLVAYLTSRKEDLCMSCAGRIETNPLRVLDCKRESCRKVLESAPDIAESLTDAARATLTVVQELLAKSSVPFVRDPRLVRGLDYYTGIIFEFVADSLGAQDTLIGGGRYDKLVQELGGACTPALGFAAGIERLALTCESIEDDGGPQLYIAPMDADALTHALTLACALRLKGVRVEVDYVGERIKQQMRRADRAKAHHVLVLGTNEVSSGKGTLKSLRGKQSLEVSLAPDILQKALVAAG